MTPETRKQVISSYIKERREAIPPELFSGPDADRIIQSILEVAVQESEDVGLVVALDEARTLYYGCYPATTTTSGPSPAANPQMGAATSVNAPATLKAEIPPQPAPQPKQPEPTPANEEKDETVERAARPPLAAHQPTQWTPADSESGPLSLVPAELKAKRNWVRWQLEAVDRRLTKVPYQLNGNKASSTNPTTWNTYEAIVNGALLSESQGIGIMTDGSFTGFDLDGCHNPETGEIKEWAQRIINLLGAYTEITPSGTGVRVYAFGQLPDGPRRFPLALSAGFGDKVQIETYHETRYFTVTGKRIGETSTLQSPNVLRAYQLCAEISREFPSEKRKQASQFSGFDSGSSVEFIQASGTVVTSKLAVLMYGTIVGNRPFEIQDEHGNKVTAPSQSEADMSLATLLAMKHGDNPELIDADFRESALYRPKWDRLAESQIAKAIATAQQIKEKKSEQPFTTTPDLEVREVSEPETEVQDPLVLPHSALTSSVLGDLYDQVFAPNDWPLELALPALTTTSSVLVPQKREGVLINPPQTTLFTSLIGPVNSGKTQVTEWSAKSVGIYDEIRGPQYAQAKFGSAEQMWKFLFKYCNREKYPNAFREAVLVVPDEWSYLMSKAGIPDASFASTLTTAFYSRQTLVTLGGAGGGKDILIPFPFSLIGGVVGEQFGDSFNSATIGGLYSRLLFGLAPDGFEWPYRDFPVQHPFFRGKGKMVLNPVAVTIAPDVWELTKGWKKSDRTLDRIPEVMVRVATIWASIDGRGTLTAKDVEKLWPLLTFQKAIRGIYRPNPGKNPDAVYANVALGWIKLHAQQWRTFKELKDGTNFYRRQLGPYVCFRTLQALARDHEIDMWVSELVGEKQQLNDLPSDYTGKRPKVGEGLVRAAR